MSVVEEIRQMAAKQVPTSVREAQALVAAGEQRLAQLDQEWSQQMSNAETWKRLAESATSDALRASSWAQAERYFYNAETIFAEIEKVEDDLAYYRQELNRLVAAAGRPAVTPAPAPTPAPVPVPVPQPTPSPTSPKPEPEKPGLKLPFGLTKNQALAAGAGALLLLVFFNPFGGQR